VYTGALLKSNIAMLALMTEQVASFTSKDSSLSPKTIWKHMGWKNVFFLQGYSWFPEGQKHLFVLLGFRGNFFRI
jgi:hypothetical protein